MLYAATRFLKSVAAAMFALRFFVCNYVQFFFLKAVKQLARLLLALLLFHTRFVGGGKERWVYRDDMFQIVGHHSSHNNLLIKLTAHRNIVNPSARLISGTYKVCVSCLDLF